MQPAPRQGAWKKRIAGHRDPGLTLLTACVCFAGINGKMLLSALGRHTPEPKSCPSRVAEPQPASLTPASIPNASPSWSRSSSQKSTAGTPSAHNSSGSSKISSGSLLSPQSPGELGWGFPGDTGVTSPLGFPALWGHPLPWQCNCSGPWHGGGDLPNSAGSWCLDTSLRFANRSH